MSDARLMTLEEAAKYLSVSLNTFRKMVARGDMPKPVRIGRCVRWDRTLIDRTLDRAAA